MISRCPRGLSLLVIRSGNGHTVNSYPLRSDRISRRCIGRRGSTRAVAATGDRQVCFARLHRRRNGAARHLEAAAPTNGGGSCCDQAERKSGAVVGDNTDLGGEPGRGQSEGNIAATGTTPSSR